MKEKRKNRNEWLNEMQDIIKPKTITKTHWSQLLQLSKNKKKQKNEKDRQTTTMSGVFTHKKQKKYRRKNIKTLRVKL